VIVPAQVERAVDHQPREFGGLGHAPALRLHADAVHGHDEVAVDRARVLVGLVYDDLYANVKGLDAFPPQEWPDHIALLYFSYHIMAGLGTWLVAVMGLALIWLWRGRLFTSSWLLWLLLLSAPAPYIATTAGWMTAELGRQPWLVYGLFRTAEGISPLVHSGNALFTLLGFLGLYLALGLLFVLLLIEILRHGPTERVMAVREVEN